MSVDMPKSYPHRNQLLGFEGLAGLLTFRTLLCQVRFGIPIFTETPAEAHEKLAAAGFPNLKLPKTPQLREPPRNRKLLKKAAFGFRV